MFENYLDVNPALYVLLVKIDKKIQQMIIIKLTSIIQLRIRLHLIGKRLSLTYKRKCKTLL